MVNICLLDTCNTECLLHAITNRFGTGSIISSAGYVDFYVALFLECVKYCQFFGRFLQFWSHLLFIDLSEPLVPDNMHYVISSNHLRSDIQPYCVRLFSPSSGSRVVILMYCSRWIVSQIVSLKTVLVVGLNKKRCVLNAHARACAHAQTGKY